VKLTSILIGYLNRVFLRDPAAVLALRIDYVTGHMTWSVADEVMTLTVNDGPGQSQSIDLTQYSIIQLSRFIAGLTGFTVPYRNAAMSQFSATVLLDATGDISQPLGDRFMGVTALPWVYLDSVAEQLEAAEDQIVQMPALMSIPTSAGSWLDFLGTYYDVPRLANEADGIYAPRITATVIQPKANNVAMEIAIQTYTGQMATVTDVTTEGDVTLSYNGSIEFDGSHTFSGGSATIQYNLFDVDIGYDLINGGTLTPFIAAVTALVGQLRAAGMHMRQISVAGSSIGDSFIRTPTDAMTPINTTENFFYDGSVNFDGSQTYDGVQIGGT
jgi:hypothetical protein